MLNIIYLIKKIETINFKQILGVTMSKKEVNSYEDCRSK
ncbi:hypothetical protein J2Z42_000731 [Clostridium algifaecis]|uniref:Uncharacterized protein n=1 Tax=Clostridium algifaecis TaxID=1472040 RepID=A0ABS4KRF0_9CLOT|nr:hypothetical protein [Clostridium algifaecis]